MIFNNKITGITVNNVSVCVFVLQSKMIIKSKKFQYKAINICLFLLTTKLDIKNVHFYLPPAYRPGTGDYKMPSVRACVRPFVTFLQKPFCILKYYS